MISFLSPKSFTRFNILRWFFAKLDPRHAPPSHLLLGLTSTNPSVPLRECGLSTPAHHPLDIGMCGNPRVL